MKLRKDRRRLLCQPGRRSKPSRSEGRERYEDSRGRKRRRRKKEDALTAVRLAMKFLRVLVVCGWRGADCRRGQEGRKEEKKEGRTRVEGFEFTPAFFFALASEDTKRLKRKKRRNERERDREREEVEKPRILTART